MGAGFGAEMSKSKSILRSSSGTSYPYPRTHTTVMVASSSRFIGPEEATVVKKQTARRRPPLNRSIPPIPESRSNESIMSYASRRSSSEKVDSSQQMECVVIENRNAIGSFQRRQNSATRIPLLSSTTNSSEERRQSKAETTPRSPLMTVAKTVKNKFSKLTRIGRHEQDISMKGSQSFSGIRQPKSSIPKRIDQNANRVIKSSSMEVTSTSQEISGSSGTKRMVVIPQNPKHLEDFSEESSLAETVVQKNTSGIVAEEAEEPPKSQEPKQSLSVTLSEDVLVISQELPPSIQSDERTDIIDLNGKPQRIQEKAMAFEEHRVKHAQASSEARNMSPSRKQHTFALGEKIPDTSSELKATEPRKSNEKIEEKSIEISALDKMGPIPRFVMTIKTPESMRKHQTFFIGLADAPVSGTVQVPSPEKQKKKKTKIIKQRSMPEASVSPERYVLRMKTPETLRRHHTFTIRERSRSPDVPYIEEGEITEPIATVGMTATKNEAAKEVRKRPNEKESTNEKLTVSVKAPSALQKLKTYIAEEKPKLKTVSSSKSADTFLSSKTSPSEHSQIVKRTAKPQMFLQSKKMQRAMENNESEHYVKKSTLTTAVVPATNTKLQALFSGETKATDQSETTRTMEQIETVVDLDREKEILENAPLKTAEMYVLTMMTPIPQRKETKVERTINDEPLERSTSPESVNLFVMGRRSHSRNCQNSGEKNSVETEAARCAVVRPNRGKIEFDRKEQSQSDRAEPIERKTSELSGEMTSPEEEIPMDTHLTPTEELHHYDALIARSIRHLSRGTSPYNRAPEVAFSDLHISGAIGEDSSQTTSRIQEKATETLLFQPSSPPKEAFKPITLSKSTSPLKIKEHSDNAVDEAKKEMKRLLNSRSKFVDRKEKPEEWERLKLEKRDVKQNSSRPQKAPITARSLRSAGKMFAPSFFRRADSKTSPKTAKIIQNPSSVTLTTKSRMNLPFRSGRRAPLAEFESSVVENSPAVENNPLILEKWNNSPRGTQRYSAHTNVFSEPIVEESDGNANVCPPADFTIPVLSNVQCMVSSALTRHEPDRGLIDDEIMDQPMLIGDTFSHSESIDCLSAVRRMEFEAEKATLISIDRSLADDDTIPRRTFDNGHAHGSTVTCAATVFTAPPPAYCRAIKEGLNEVEDIRSQLEKLQRLVAQETRGTEMERLIRENEALRRELHEKNELIASLRLQIASQRS
ncbi:hypothetical protein Angca_000863 [Angiostrongylus cantonensis]|nr:hypothetical protein Angca_000863 [Angiostrongylus cantonensis]